MNKGKEKMAMPPRKVAAATEAPATDENKVRDFIGKGGKPATADRPADEPPATGKPATADKPAPMKNINVKLLATEMDAIHQLRAKRGKSRSGKKLGISLHDWIVEAVQEKIVSDGRKPAKRTSE